MPDPARQLPRALSVLVLAAVGAICWYLLVAGAESMETMRPVSPGTYGQLVYRAAVAMMRPGDTLAYLAASALMWVLMMIAMMTPAALPVVLLYQRTATASTGRTLAFAAGYLGIWCLFGVLLTGVQWGLHMASLLHSMALRTETTWAAVLLICAGLYQFTPLKRACLRHCQTPLAFLLNHWRNGTDGACVMGVTHGRYCLGCCWVLMLLMFAGGVMSVGAMALLAAFILLERLLPAGLWASAVPGALMLAAGVALLLA